MSMSSSKVKLKLLIDKKNEKVLFAEASKEFVDFHFSLMSLPLEQVVKLLTKNKMVACSIMNLYHSIESLSKTYIKSSENVESVLNPKGPMVSLRNPLLLSSNIEYSFSRRKEVYMCLYKEQGIRCGRKIKEYVTNYHPHAADIPNTDCPVCSRKMNTKLQLVESAYYWKRQVASATGVGFVEGVVTYMVMDNLEVKAMSTISTIALINSFNVKDLSSLEEKIVDVVMEEGLRILQQSLQSKDVLTSVFLRNLEEI